MKKIFLILSVFGICITSKAQDQRKPFEDAIAIAHSLGNNTDYIETLKKYEPDVTKLEAFIKANIFLSANTALKNSITADKANQADVISSIQSSGSGYSFIPQHQAIDALGTFIAERFKEELNIAFINKFRDKLKAQTDLQAVLPTTYKFLLENEPYNYTSFLEALRAALKQDLEALPSSMMTLSRNHKSEIVRSLTDDGYVALIMGLEGVNSFLKKNSSAQILIDITNVNEVSDIKDKAFKFSVTLLNRSVSELTDHVSHDWYDSDAMKEILLDRQKVLLFLGLFYEKHKSLFTGMDVSKSLPMYMEQVTRSYTVISSYQSKLKDLRTLTGSQPTQTEVIEYLSLTINAAEELLNAEDVFGMSFQNTFVKDDLIPYARRAVAIVRNIDQREYASAFVNSLSLISDLLPTETTFKREFVKYGNFAVTIVTAENADAMVQALESAALPVGSYKIKRESFYNISLNAYAGAFLGMEYLNERGDISLPDDVESSSGVAGFTAPLGIAFSMGSCTDYNSGNSKHADYRRFTGKKKEKVLTGGSWTLFVSAIDLGAVTAFRLTNDKSEALPEVKFENVLAPGLYVIRGFKKVPVSWGLGAQYGPQARKIADLGSDQELISSWSARIFIAVDIPLINFYTRNEK